MKAVIDKIWARQEVIVSIIGNASLPIATRPSVALQLTPFFCDSLIIDYFWILHVSSFSLHLLLFNIKMAERQRTFSTMLFGNSQANAKKEFLPLMTSTLALTTSSDSFNFIGLAQKNWKDAWYTFFYWIQFNSRISKVFVKFEG